ncbi:MAG: SIS domain-containing protein [Candidatus Aenigmatarchaeota archaeon]
MKIKIFDKSGNEVLPKERIFYLPEFKLEKNFEHYMLKEIHEQPQTSKILIESLKHEQNSVIDKIISLIYNSKKIVFIAAGSSYHASLIASHLFRKLGFESFAIIASEYEEFNYDKNTLVFAVSQSGETMDTIIAVKNLKDKVNKIVSVINIPHSTLHRLADYSIEIKAGIEKCVAATKTYTNQVITFFYLAKLLGMNLDLEKIPKEISESIKENEDKIKNNFAPMLKSLNNLFIIGRSVNYYSSLEIALKLKEISYIHAEALYGGELKHGTLALIDENSCVLALNPYWDKHIKTNIEEVKARGAKVLEIPKDFYVNSDYPYFSLYSVIIGQLLTYYIAKEKNLPIDYPRNLAKSVTVI